MHSAPDVPRDRFHAMTRLDENRARAQLAAKAHALPGEVRNLGIWGNHSDTMFPDWYHAEVRGGPATAVADEAWFQGDFLRSVATRGKAIIEARGTSSAASAASAAIDHMSTLWHGTAPGEFSSMGICSKGEYGIPAGLIFSFPVTASGGNATVVPGIVHNSFARAAIDKTAAELVSERETVKHLLG